MFFFEWVALGHRAGGICGTCTQFRLGRCQCQRIHRGVRSTGSVLNETKLAPQPHGSEQPSPPGLVCRVASPCCLHSFFLPWRLRSFLLVTQCLLGSFFGLRHTGTPDVATREYLRKISPPVMLSISKFRGTPTVPLVYLGAPSSKGRPAWGGCRRAWAWLVHAA